jgi:hypothetical protein
MALTAEQQEVADKVEALCVARYGSKDGASQRKLFESYDESGNGTLSGAELSVLLADADVGNGLTRSLWVDGIFAALDKDPEDAELSWDEYESAAKTETPTVGPMTPYGRLPPNCAASGVCIAPAVGTLPRVRPAPDFHRPAMVGAAGILGWILLGPLGGVLGAVVTMNYTE